MFAKDDDGKTQAIEKCVERAKKFHALIEKNLEHHGGRFAAGNNVTIADFIMASYIGNYLLNPKFAAKDQAMATIGETPKFQAYLQTVQDEFSYLKTRPEPAPMW